MIVVVVIFSIFIFYFVVLFFIYFFILFLFITIRQFKFYLWKTGETLDDKPLSWNIKSMTWLQDDVDDDDDDDDVGMASSFWWKRLNSTVCGRLAKWRFPQLLYDSHKSFTSQLVYWCPLHLLPLLYMRILLNGFFVYI